MMEIKEKKLTIKEAAGQLCLSNRQTKRLVRRFKDEGEKGLINRWHGSGKRYTEEFKAAVVEILSVAPYKGCKPTFTSEKLYSEKKIYINRETLRQVMIENGLWKGKKKKDVVSHQSRPRRSRFGELIQVDGSHHDWFEGRAPKCCLLVFIDDATSRIMNLRFELTETAMGYFRCVKNYVMEHGVPVSLYTDRYGVFTVNKADTVSGLLGHTQFQRAMRELKIELILANSPQAKGRVERANQTLQDRLIKEMRFRNINSIEEAHEYLPAFIKEHNDRYAIQALESLDSHRALHVSEARLGFILSHQEIRKLTKNLEFGYNNTIYQIKRPGGGYSFRGTAVTVCECMDGSIRVYRNGECLTYTTIKKSLYKLEVADRKEVNALLDRKIIEQAWVLESTIGVSCVT